MIRGVLLKKLENQGVTMLTEVELGTIDSSELEVVGEKGGTQKISADAVILGNKFMADTSLLSSLRGKVSSIYLIGGSRDRRDMQDAVYDGFQAGRKI